MAFQRWIKAYLEEDGYIVHNQTSCGKMIFLKNKKKIYVSTRNDIFGCIDLIGIKEGHPILWIQATLDTSLKRKKEKLQVMGCIIDDMNITCRRLNDVQLWVKRKTSVIDIYQMDSSGDFKLIGKIIRRKFYKEEK